MAYDAPSYLSGDARVRWHKQRAANAFTNGVIAGGAAGLMLHPKTGGDMATLGQALTEAHVGKYMERGDALRAGRFVGQHFQKAGYAAGAYAVHQGVSGAVHTHKANKYEKAYNERKRKAKASSEYYTRTVNGKTQRVRKGKRK